MTEHNLPDKDDAPWLNLSPKEVQELRSKKQELTEYGREKLRKLMTEELKHFSLASVDYYQVAYKYNNAAPNEYRTQKHDTMRMALAAANFLDARGKYTIISVTPIYK